MMFALEVEYLTGRAVATKRDDWNSAEWPPHPGRLFMALVAAHAERNLEDDAERAALTWLEGLRPPLISAADASHRQVLEVYVPVNDNFGPDKLARGGFTRSVIADKVRVLPERRSKQARTFPSVTPDSPRVDFIWNDARAEDVAIHRSALERLASNVTYLGHSSSLVLVAVCDDPSPPTWVPSEEGRQVMRVPTPGRLMDLLAAYQSQAKPLAGFYCGYAEARADGTEIVPESSIGSMFSFRLQGPPLPLTSAEMLAGAVRDAWMRHSPVQPPPEMLSGHAFDNSPTQRDHLAILPLAFVDHRHADGLIRGFAAAIPQALQGQERVQALCALGMVKELWMGPLGKWTVERMVGESSLHSLKPGPYLGPSAHWVTVTPMVLDRFPKNRPGQDVNSLVAKACRRIGLPDPIQAEISRVPFILGVPPSPAFSPQSKPGVPPRPHTHVSILFDRQVRGPVALGAGRYRGLGLFRIPSTYPVSRGGTT